MLLAIPCFWPPVPEPRQARSAKEAQSKAKLALSGKITNAFVPQGTTPKNKRCMKRLETHDFNAG